MRRRREPLAVTEYPGEEPAQYTDAHDPDAHDPDAQYPDAHDPDAAEYPDAHYPDAGYPGEEPVAVQDTSTDLLAVLSVPATADDLTPVLSRRPRAKLPSLTMTLCVLVIAAAGFFGGAEVGKHDSGSGAGGLAAFRGAAASAAAGRTGTGRTGTGGFGGFGAGGTGGSAAGADTIGTVKLVQGNIVYVETTAGSIVQVAVSSGTKITVSSSGTVKDLQPGQSVIVAGAKSSSGGVNATTITQGSGTGGFGAGGFGAGSGG
jgi:hypothetical protein